MKRRKFVTGLCLTPFLGLLSLAPRIPRLPGICVRDVTELHTLLNRIWRGKTPVPPRIFVEDSSFQAEGLYSGISVIRL
jgi:hypothetical protein